MYRIINVCQKYIDKRCLVLLKAKKKKPEISILTINKKKKNHILKHFSRVVTISKKIIPCYS